MTNSCFLPWLKSERFVEIHFFFISLCSFSILLSLKLGYTFVFEKHLTSLFFFPTLNCLGLFMSTKNVINNKDFLSAYYVLEKQ